MGVQVNTRPGQRWVLALTSAASLMVALDTLVVSTALSTIRVRLGASIEALEWTMNAYSLSFAVLLMTAAVLGDRFGRRRVFAGGIGLFTAASAACALSGSAGWLIAARAVQGAGAALVMPLAMALLTAAFPAHKRGRALGIFSGLTGLAVLGGPVVGGAVTQGLAWQWIFWLNVPIGVVLIPLVLRRIPESLAGSTRLDIGGLTLVTGGALGLVLGLVRANDAGWASPEVMTALASGALLTGGFAVWELRVREPMLPMRFFRSRAFSAANAAGLLMFASLFGAVFFMAQFLQTGLRYGPLAAGLRLAPWTATLFVVAPIAGGLVNRLGERLLMAAGLALQAAGMGWIALIAGPGLHYATMVAPLVVAGCGISMAMPAAQNSVVGSVTPAAIGKASGTFNMMRQLGGVFGIAVLVAVFAGGGGYTSAAAFAHGFARAVGISAGLSLLGAAAGLAVPGRHGVAGPARTPLREGARPSVEREVVGAGVDAGPLLAPLHEQVVEKA
ncbi:MAG: MFS transporter [Micromonosporaceae bacterium]